jgi:hypothetical protein
MSEDEEQRFKNWLEIYISNLRLLGAANATAVLAAGAAFQAFEKRPEAQSSIKLIIGFFFAGIVTFTISQIAIFLLQSHMNIYFERQKEAAKWKVILYEAGINKSTTEQITRMARHNLIVIGFAGLASLVLFLVGLGFVANFLTML